MFDNRSFDLDKYLKEKYNLVLDRSCRVSPEFQEAIRIELEKELKMNVFAGVFVCDIENGRIRIPWNIDVSEEQLIWLLIKTDKKEKIVVTYSKDYTDKEDCEVLKQGTCELYENGDWILPDPVLNVIGCERCVWVGRSRFSELMSERDHEAMNSETNTDALKKQLLGE